MVPVAEFSWDYTPTNGELGHHDESFELWCAQAQKDWAQHFPVRHGYVLLTLPLPDGSKGYRLSALRGDFRADLDLRWTPDLLSKDRSAGSLCVQSKAQSQRLAHAKAQAIAWSSMFANSRVWLAPLMFLLGGACILAAGTWSHLILLGVLSFVIATFLTYAGVWKDHVQRHLQSQAWSSMLSDGAVQGDLRRWRALGQVMERRRRDLSLSPKASPFRRGPRAALSYKCA